MKNFAHNCECMQCAAEAAGLSPDTHSNWLASTVRSCGWAVPSVLADELGPGWAYTVGLWHTHHAPELAMFGLDAEDMTVLLNGLADRMVAGVAVGVGDEVTGLCAAALTIRPVHDSWRGTSMFATWQQFYAWPGPPVLQVVWPDKDGHLPWAPGFSAHLAGLQPFLWLPREDHPPGPWAQIDRLNPDG